MSRANLGWLFYKEMYRKGNNDTHIKSTLHKITSISTIKNDIDIIGDFSFELTTVYPGLIIGSGYIHGISSDEDTKMGFYFDHTTGLPIIPASSIKGVLRSLFGLNEKDKYQEEKKVFIEEVLKEIGIEKSIDIEALAKEIFEGLRYDQGSQEYKNISIYKRDIFYDAFIVRCGNDSLIQEDYITPHKKALKNPVPLKIIKVAGGVTFRFNFELQDGIISANEKERLFVFLLLWHGLGAKTNVGYGQFVEWSDDDWKRFNNRQNRRKQEQEKKGLDGFELFIKELEEFKKKDNNMVKKIKEYKGKIEDIERVKEIVNSKKGADKFHNRIMKYLDSLN